MSDDHETWLIEAGHDVIAKKVAAGANALTLLERLIDCMWVADYGMRNAGDLETASDLYQPFQDEALQLAQALNLPVTMSAFALSRDELERDYFNRFDGICNELRLAQSGPAQAQ